VPVGDGLRLEVEVCDTLDETCLLSAEGQLSTSHHPHELRIEGADRCEVAGQAFSAASRDPEQRRFASIADYFRRGPDTVGERIVVRLYVRDEWRDRQALLWDVHFDDELQCLDVTEDDPMRPYLHEGSRRIEQSNYLPIHSSVLPGGSLRARLAFYVRPEAGQDGVAEADKLWRLAEGDEDNYGDHDSFFSLQFDHE
jgi:hypothetical protein